MFVLRSLFWLTTLVLLLPPTHEGGVAPRISLLQTAYATKVLLQDLTGVCARNPQACEASRDALVLLAAKIETGAGIVSAGISASRSGWPGEADRGTLEPTDLEPDWSVAARP